MKFSALIPLIAIWSFVAESVYFDEVDKIDWYL